MKRFALLFALFSLISQAADLTITVTGIRNDNGKIAALAFTQDQGFPDRVNQAFAQAQVNAQKGTVTLTIKNVPAGKVALTVLHDEDGDGKLRKNLLGIPQEGVGMTGKPLGNRAPKFQEAVIEIKDDEKKTIALKYW
jgi:uncharacterized protein (DUF2141 family)